MRILVISLPRTGSTSFSKKLAQNNSLSFVFEPFAPNAELFNTIKNFETDYTKDNIVVKTLMNDVYEVDWFVKLAKDFDKTYLLSRKNLQKCIESWAYLSHNRGDVDFETEYYWERTPNYNVCFNEIHRWDNKLKILSEKLKESIIYYEDIFDINNNRLRKGDKQFDKKII
jgi:hypothetical protein